MFRNRGRGPHASDSETRRPDQGPKVPAPDGRIGLSREDGPPLGAAHGDSPHLGADDFPILHPGLARQARLATRTRRGASKPSRVPPGKPRMTSARCQRTVQGARVSHPPRQERRPRMPVHLFRAALAVARRQERLPATAVSRGRSIRGSLSSLPDTCPLAPPDSACSDVNATLRPLTRDPQEQPPCRRTRRRPMPAWRRGTSSGRLPAISLPGRPSAQDWMIPLRSDSDLGSVCFRTCDSRYLRSS